MRRRRNEQKGTQEDAVRDYEAEEELEQELARRRRARRAAMKRKRRRRERRKRILILCAFCVCLVLLLAAGIRAVAGLVSRHGANAQAEEQTELAALQKTPGEAGFADMAELWQSETAAAEQEEIPFETGYTAEVTASTVEADSEAVTSTYALLIDLDDNTIVAQRNARDRINPASMTKILTVLVAAEHITDLDDTFTITREITDYSYSNGCSSAGFDDGETVTVRDLFYGTILPSGADAAAGLAMYVSGSLEDFVGLMNEKIEELGLSADTHFTNCVGLYDENHYTTPYDMAMIMKAAMENELCQEVMSARKYTTSSTTEHPDGIELSNWFLRRIEDKDTNGEVLCAKTGYVVQSGNCASSYLVSDSGRHYICVTADAHSSWRCIYDHVAMYEKYAE
jgi:D-alanyl-D-alanine carboxypeptidase (penicillin-binding protein 5/6)